MVCFPCFTDFFCAFVFCVLSVPQLCKSKLTVAFQGETVEISNSEGDTLITSFLNPVKDLFIVPIDDDAEQQRVN